MDRYTVSSEKKDSTIKLLIYFKLIYRYNEIPIKVLIELFTKLEKLMQNY